MPGGPSGDQRTAQASQPAPGRRIGLAAALLIAAVTLVAGAVFGYWLAGSQAREAAREAAVARDELETLARAHEKLQERNWMLYLELEAAQAEEPEDVAPPEAGVFTDGTYRVGTDIEPGTYRGEVTREFGYWARLNSATGVISGIIANDIVRGPFVVTIIPSDFAIELRGVTLTAE